MLSFNLEKWQIRFLNVKSADKENIANALEILGIIFYQVLLTK